MKENHKPQQDTSLDTNTISAVFTTEEEAELISWVCDCWNNGLIVSYEDLFDEVDRIIVAEQRCVKQKQYIHSWLGQLIERHATRLRAATLSDSPVLPHRAEISANYAKYWRKPFGQDFSNIIQDSNKIFSLSQALFRMDVFRVCVKAVLTHADRVEPGQALVSYVCAASAAGLRTDPMFVCPSTCVASLSSSSVSGDSVPFVRDDLDASTQLCVNRTSEDGRITSYDLVAFVMSILDPFLTESAITRPVGLWLDAAHHCSSLALWRFCSDERIMLFGLPPAQSSCNPVHVGIIELLLANQYRVLDAFKSPTKSVNTLSLSQLFSSVQLATKRVCGPSLKQAFTTCGLYPYSSDIQSVSVVQKNSNNCSSSTTKYCCIVKDCTQSDSKRARLTPFPSRTCGPVYYEWLSHFHISADADTDSMFVCKKHAQLVKSAHTDSAAVTLAAGDSVTPVHTSVSARDICTPSPGQTRRNSHSTSNQAAIPGEVSGAEPERPVRSTKLPRKYADYDDNVARTKSVGKRSRRDIQTAATAGSSGATTLAGSPPSTAVVATGQLETETASLRQENTQLKARLDSYQRTVQTLLSGLRQNIDEFLGTKLSDTDGTYSKSL